MAYEPPFTISRRLLSVVEAIAALRERIQGVDGKWHGYLPHPEARTLAAALAVIHADANGCFFG